MHCGVPDSPVPIHTADEAWLHRDQSALVCGFLPRKGRARWIRVASELTLSGEPELWKFRMKGGKFVLLERKVDAPDAPSKT